MNQDAAYETFGQTSNPADQPSTSKGIVENSRKRKRSNGDSGSSEDFVGDISTSGDDDFSDSGSNSPTSPAKRKDSYRNQSDATSKRLKRIVDNLEMPSDGLKLNQHGPDFQLNILTRVLWRAKDCNYDQFRLATELPGAEKLDDVVFQYCNRPGDRWKLRLFQIKHKEGVKIQKVDKANLISTDDDKDFAIFKYFKSFIKIRIRCLETSLYSPFSGGDVDDVCLITNTDFCSEELRNCFGKDLENINDDKLLGFRDLNQTYSYKIVEGSNFAMEVIAIFNATSDFSNLVQTLAFNIVKGLKIDKTISCVKDFTHHLKKQVFVCEKAGDEFALKFSKQFLEGEHLPDEVIIFRTTLLKEIAFLKHSWKFNVSQNFGKRKLPEDESDMREIASKLAHSIENSEELKSQDFLNSQTILAAEVVNCGTEKFRNAFINPEKEKLRSLRDLVKQELSQLRGVKKVTNKDLERVDIKISQDFGDSRFPNDLYIVNKIGQAMVEAWQTGTPLETCFDGAFEVYQESLANGVVDVNSGQFHDAFINGVMSNANLLQFRRVLINKIVTEDALITLHNFFENAKLPLTKGLAIDFLSKCDLTLQNPKEFAQQFHSIFTSFNPVDRCIEISQTKFTTSSEDFAVFKANARALGEGNVIIKKFSTLRFSSNFILMGKLDGNLEDFRNELITIFQSENLNHLAEYTLKVDIDGFRCYDEEYSLKLLPHPYEPEHFKEFFEKFKLILNYPNRFEVSSCLQREMCDQFGSLDSNAFRVLYQGNLQKWMSERIGTFYTAERAKKLFDVVSQDLRCWQMDGISRSYFAMVPMKYVFKAISDRIRSFLEDKNDQILCLSFEHLLLGRIRITQTFLCLRSEKTLDCLQYTNMFGYIFFLLRQLKNSSFLKELMNALNETGKWNLVVIEWHPKQNFKRIIERLKELLCGSVKRKIIFITEENDNSSNILKEANLSLEYARKLFVPTNFYDLTENSQLAISQTGKIFLQKAALIVEEIIDHEVKPLIDASTILKFVTGEQVEIGLKLHFSDEYDPSYYVSRLLDMDVEIKEEVRQKCSDVIVISEREEDYIEACENLNEKTRRSVHWLREKLGKFYWQKSLGSIKFLVEHREVDAKYRIGPNKKLIKENDNPNPIKSLPEDNLTTIGPDTKLLIISNTAGMGKSTILCNLSKQIKNRYPQVWVIRVDLNEYSSYFSSELINRNANRPNLKRKDASSAIKFLVLLLRSNKKSALKTNFEENMFTHALMKPLKLKIVLLFDGFDEISPTYKDIVLDLLLGLQLTCVEKLIVTTRPYMQRNLERSLEVFACSLQQFTKSDQIYFLTHFLRKRMRIKSEGTSIDDTRLEIYVTSLIQKQADTIQDKHMEFTGVPLQLRLLAEVFQESEEGCDWQGCFDFLISDNQIPTLPDRLNIFELYAKFSEKKYFIYRKDKMRQDMTNVAAEIESFDSFKTFVKQHQKMAIFALFDSETDLNVLLSMYGDYEEELEEIESYLLKINSGQEMRGIINQVVNGKPHFIHRTFAEFFVADFIGYALARRYQLREFHELLLKKVMAFSIELNPIAAFFDKWLETQRSKIPQSTTQKLGDSIVDLWNRSGKKWSEFLHNPCENAYVEIVKLVIDSLTEHACSLNEIVNSYSDQYTALYKANTSGSLELVKLLVHHGANVDAPVNGATVVQNAATSRRLHIAKWLATPKDQGGGGADVHISWHFGRSTLDAAIYSGDLEFCEQIAALGVPLDSVDEHGRTPLHAASLVGQLHLVQWLISKGVNKEARDKRGYNALNYASITGKLHISDWLVLPSESGGGGLDINAKTQNGMTLLHTASLASNLNLLQWLLDRGFDINSSDDSGRTPVLLAAQLGHLNVIRWLLERGANINAITKQGQTILHLAASAKKSAACEWLIEQNLNPDVPDNNGLIPIQLAALKGHIKLVEKLLSGKDALYGIHSNGDTLLHFASMSGKIEICEWILQCQKLAEAGLHINSQGKNKRTALHLAMGKNLRLIRGLLERGADKDCRDEQGCHIIHYAAGYGKLEIFKWLIKTQSDAGLGVDFTLRTNDGSTVLHLAMESGDLKFCEYLVEEVGLDVGAVNNDGQTPLFIAEKNENLEIIDFLKKRSN